MSAKREAKAYEKSAARRETAKGKFHTPLGKIHYHDPYSVAQDYESAAREWVTARNPKKAYANYSKAAEIYSRVAGSEQEYMTREKGNFISNKHHLRYVAAIKKSEQARKNAERLKKVLEGRWHGLEGRTIAAVIISLICGIFFLSTNITGNAIGNLTTSTSNMIGVVLLVVGLVAGFYYFKNRK